MQNKILNTITLSAGSVTVYENNGLKLHSYATGDALADVAYIVEGKDELIGIELPAFTASLEAWQEYIKTHFQHEEHLQRQSDYPDYPAHRHCHETFIRTVEHLSNRLEQEGATVQLTTELNQCLCSWMIHHIKIADTKFAYYLSHREQKLPAEA